MEFFRHLSAFILGFLACLIAVLMFGVLQAILIDGRSYDSRHFDAEHWKSESGGSDRLEMMTDLQYYYISNGMERSEITDLLGTPDNVKGDSVITYQIGAKGILASNEKLVFKMKDGRVKDFKIE